MKPRLDLMQLAGLGTNLIIDAKTKPTAELIQIVSSVGLNDEHITIRNAHSKPTLDLMQTVNVHPKNVTLDFTDYFDKQ